MPQSVSFTDLDITFDKHPITSDLMVTKNATAIQRSIYDLILTLPGEIFFDPNVGCLVNNLLFEPLDLITASMIQKEIQYTIDSFEPRVSLTGVVVNIDDENNAFNIDISYNIIGKPIGQQQLQMILYSTR
jgi:hypothetical protein